MTEQQKQDAIEFIEHQLDYGYVDLSQAHDGRELKVVEEAIEMYKKRHKNRAYWKWNRNHWECSRCAGSRFHDLLLGCDAVYCGYCGAEMVEEEDV